MILEEFIHPKSNYFEAILQLRGTNDEVLRFVANHMRKRPSLFLAQVVQVKGGYDAYVSDQRWTRSLGPKLKRAFKGELKESRKIYGVHRQSSKTLYRAIVCFRMTTEQERPDDETE